MSDTELIKLTIDHYWQMLPHPANASQSSLSAALKAVRVKQGAILFDKFQASAFDLGSIAIGAGPMYSYRFTIVNNVGEEVDHVTIRRTDSQYTDVAQIFSDIYRKVNRIDEQLDEIIAELAIDKPTKRPK